MSRLTAEQAGGVWAGITMTWDEKYRFDEETYAQNISSMIRAGVHGLYTTGSTGEFYAIEYDEFCRMVDIEAQLCGGAGMPLQIGCCTDATAKTIRLLEYAAGKKDVGAAQVCIPYWMELTDRELLQFFKDVSAACPDMPLVHYNIPRAKRFLGGDDYLKLLDAGVNLIAVKFTMAGGHFADLQDAIMKTPDLAYYVGESLLASGMQIGACGSCSSLVGTDPNYMLRYYDAAARGQWDEAIKMQKHVAKFFDDCFDFIVARNEGLMDPVFDKGLGVASGCVAGHQRCRKPYIGWSDQTVSAFGQWLKENYPEFVYKGS